MTRAEVTGKKPHTSADRVKQPSGPPIALAFDIPDFCRAYRISLRLYFKLRDAGLGPREMRLGRRVLITVESAQAWARAREQATADAS
jgi:hypothetical protein